MCSNSGQQDILTEITHGLGVYQSLVATSLIALHKDPIFGGGERTVDPEPFPYSNPRHIRLFSGARIREREELVLLVPSVNDFVITWDFEKSQVRLGGGKLLHGEDLLPALRVVNC
jgi:hypothetical protein